MGLSVPLQPTMVSELVRDDLPDQYFQFSDGVVTPPDDHMVLDFTEGPPAVAFAPYVGIAYIDANNSGGWSLDEMALATGWDVAESDQHQIMYIEARDWSANWISLYLGMGWQVFQNPPYDQPEALPTLIPWTEGLVLDAASDPAP
jgi:hypothetical protein